MYEQQQQQQNILLRRSVAFCINMQFSEEGEKYGKNRSYRKKILIEDST